MSKVADRVTFGLIASGLKPQGMPPPHAFRAVGERVEELGFDSVWIADRIASPSQGTPILECTTTLGGFIGFTRRITVGASVLLLPLRHPTLLAKQLATLDFLSEGRLVIGLGMGINPKDYEAVQMPFTERGRRADEAIEIMRMLFEQPSGSHDGRFFRFKDVWMEPPPVQDGGPPMWVGGTSEAALRRAGRLGDGWIAFQIAPDQFQASFEVVRKHAANAGRDPDLLQPGLMIPIHVGQDGDQVRSEAQESFSQRFQRPIPMEMITGLCAVGTSEECTDKLMAFVNAGVRHFVLNPIALTPDPVEDCDRIFEEVVQPTRSAVS